MLAGLEDSVFGNIGAVWSGFWNMLGAPVLDSGFAPNIPTEVAVNFGSLNKAGAVVVGSSFGALEIPVVATVYFVSPNIPDTMGFDSVGGPNGFGFGGCDANGLESLLTAG